MATFDSDKVNTALTSKLKCERITDRDHVNYLLHDTDGTLIGTTCMSHGSKHTIDEHLIKHMTRQIGLMTSKNFANFVSCTLSAADCIAIIKQAK
jgi:hypothetical protein